MTSKHWTLVGGAVACLIGVSAAAAPWIEPGDARARFSLQALADRGNFDRNVSTWPIMWTSVHHAMSKSYGDLNEATAYLDFEKKEQAEQAFRAEIAMVGSSEELAIQGFDHDGNDKSGAGIDLQWQSERWAAALGVQYVHEAADNESLRFDGSYVAANLGNWVIGAGTIPRWWGPGWQSSLILSNNARSVPAFWLNRENPAAPESEWLHWVGPWQLTLLAGQLEAEREISKPKLLGVRLTIRPVAGFDVGFSRIILLGGDGRPENGRVVWDALVGRDNSQDGAENDPGNQLASLDFRYGFAIKDQSAGIYAQMMGEDEAGAFPARKSWLLGLDWTTGLFKSQQQWFFEYTNTIADDLLGNAMPNISYEHFNYKTGYRYYGRNLASSFEGDAESYTLGVFNFFREGSNLGLFLSHARLNTDGASRVVVTDDDIFYNVPDVSQSVIVANLSYGTEVLNGWLDINARITDENLQFVSGEKDQWSLGAKWRYRF